MLKSDIRSLCWAAAEGSEVLRCSRELITTRVCSKMGLKSDIRGLCWAVAEGSESWV